MKRLSCLALFFLSILSSSLIPLTANASSSNPFKNGRLYAGIQAGEDNYQISNNVLLLDDDVDLVTMNPSISAQDLVGGLLLGYGYFFPHHLYLAAETFFNLNQARSNMTYYSNGESGLDIDQLNSQFQVHNSYGLALLPGISINSHILIYARIGWIWTLFKSNQFFAIDQGLGVNEIDVYFNRSARIPGFNLGLGLEAFLTNSLSIRGEYNHIDYTSFSNPTAAYGTVIKYTPHNHQILLSAIYSFTHL